MNIYLKKEIWDDVIKGWLITDCAVRDKNIICLCLRQNLPDEVASRLFDHDIQTILMAIYLDTPDDQYGARTLVGYSKPKLGIARLPKSQALLTASNSNGQTSVYLGGKGSPDEFIHPNGWPLTNRIKCINGYAYSVGDGRQIYKRVDIAKWQKIDQGLPKGDATRMQGFNDMDAFSETDMYAVGGHGDVWHFNGKEWRQMGFPSNVQLATVTCAGDGKVYISGEAGALWVGRESTWKRVFQGESSILWNDVLWFENKLWLASDYQFRIWDGKQIQRVMHKGKEVHIRGHMDVRDGLLAIASPHEAMAFDGKDWRVIVAPYN